MLSDDEILEQAARRFTDFFDCTQFWRQQELIDSYALDESKQWLPDDAAQYRADGIPLITINKTSPVIDAIAGFEVQNRSEVSYVPRLIDAKDTAFADMAENGINGLEKNAQSAFHNSQAFRDMLVCGIGATDTLVDYTHNDRGEMVEERIFPGFLMWDPAARKKNLKDKNWVGKARVVDKSILEEENDGEEFLLSSSFSFEEVQFLNFYSLASTRLNLTVIYDYQWRVKEKAYRIRNPFKDQSILQSDLIMNWAAQAENTYRINLDDSSFSFFPQEWRQFKKAAEALGIALEEPIRREKYRYYRAEIRGGRIYSKSENYSQKDFSIEIMTGKYSETDQCFYGVYRAAKEGQRLLNKSVSNFQAFLDTIPKGGVHIEKDAVDDVKGFINTYSKARKVTVYRKGALSGGMMIPKVTPPVPAGLLEMITFGAQAIMDTVGVNPQFMGLMESKEMTGKLQAQLVRQALTVLATYFDAKKFFTIDKGYLYLDCLRVLAENDPGRLIRNTSGKSAEQYLKLNVEDLAAEYDIEIQDVPATSDEKQETFEKLLELAGMLAQQGVNIMPLTMQYAPLKQEEIDQVMQAMIPPPPPPPDPLQEEMLKSTIAVQYANAQKTKADAVRINIETLNKQQENITLNEKMNTDIDKTISETNLNKAKTVTTLMGN